MHSKLSITKKKKKKKIYKNSKTFKVKNDQYIQQSYHLNIFSQNSGHKHKLITLSREIQKPSHINLCAKGSEIETAKCCELSTKNLSSFQSGWSMIPKVSI